MLIYYYAIQLIRTLHDWIRLEEGLIPTVIHFTKVDKLKLMRRFMIFVCMNGNVKFPVSIKTVNLQRCKGFTVFVGISDFFCFDRRVSCWLMSSSTGEQIRYFHTRMCVCDGICYLIDNNFIMIDYPSLKWLIVIYYSSWRWKITVMRIISCYHV